MLNDWALNLNDEEERCAQGACPDSGRKDYCRALNQNRSLEVINGNKKQRHIFIMMTKKTANCISNFKMRTCNYFEYHWCIPEKVKGMFIVVMKTYLGSSLILVLIFFFLSPLGFYTAGSQQVFVALSHMLSLNAKAGSGNVFLICALQWLCEGVEIPGKEYNRAVTRWDGSWVQSLVGWALRRKYLSALSLGLLNCKTGL